MERNHGERYSLVPENVFAIRALEITIVFIIWLILFFIISSKGERAMGFSEFFFV